MIEPICPLSDDQNLTLLEEIPTAGLISFYRKSYNIDVSVEFEGLRRLSFYRCNTCDLRFFHPLAAGSEAFYCGLQGLNWYFRDDKDEYEYAREFVKTSDVVLEVGCGKGAFVKKIPTRKYVGLDFSGEALRLAQLGNPGLLFKQESIETHASDSAGAYDVVCAFQVLEHIRDPRSFVRNSIACLKPGGLLIFSAPSVDSYLSFASNAILNMPPHHVTWWSHKALASLGEIFDIRMLELRHETMTAAHQRQYASVLIMERLRKSLGHEYVMVDTSLAHRVLSKVASLGADWLTRGVWSDELLPPGPSVTVVYKKPENTRAQTCTPHVVS